MNPAPLQPPLISDEEVELLLQQAESLVDTISDDTGAMAGDPNSSAVGAVSEAIADRSSIVDPLDDPAWSVTDAIVEDVFTTHVVLTESAVERSAADPLQAIATTEAIADEITAILDEAADTADAPPVPAPETRVADPVADRTATPTLSAADAVPRAALDEVAEESVSSLSLDTAPPEIHGAAPSEQVHCIDAQTPSIEPPPANNSASQSSRSMTRTPFKARLTALHHVAILILTAVPIALVNLALRLIVFLDRPFARYSVETKLRIGLAALATLFMGAAAWVLPRIALQNPYAAMGQ